MLLPSDRSPLTASGAGLAPAPSPVAVPGDTVSPTLAPPASPVSSTPSRVEIQGLGVHIDPTSAPPATPVDGFTLGDLPTSPPITFAQPVDDPGAKSGAPPASPIGSSGSTLRSITPRDRPLTDLIASKTPTATATPLPGAASSTPLIALVTIAAVALAWWLMKRGSIAL